MRRALCAALAVVVLAGGAAVVASGVLGAGGSGSRGAGAGQKPPGQAPMPAAASGPPGGTSAALHRRVAPVTIRNFAFMPARIVVSSGTRVVWTNQDSDPHTVASDASGGLPPSAALDTGGRFVAVVTHAQTITYHCTIHPYMHGVLVVQP